METLSFELRKLGLTEKEVRVYLAALEFGYAAAQKIAQKLNISRPTIYEIIKGLKTKGLMMEFKEAKRTYFTAESPDKLLRIKTRSGRQITATHYHSFVIRKNNKITTVAGSSLKIGNRIPAARKIVNLTNS